jgi:hypothetical protein
VNPIDHLMKKTIIPGVSYDTSGKPTRPLQERSVEREKQAEEEAANGEEVAAVVTKERPQDPEVLAELREVNRLLRLVIESLIGAGNYDVRLRIMRDSQAKEEGEQK